MTKLLLIALLLVTSCGGAPPPANTLAVEKPPPAVAIVPLSQIDLTKIGRVAPKGRVQDNEYNRLPVVDHLIAHGNEAVPFLIAKLDDETKIEDHVFDYWYAVHVGDVAFVILTDFFTDPTWKKTTIPGVGYDEFLQRGANTDATAEQLLQNFIARHGRHEITDRWRKVWAQYKDRAYWDDKDRCFKIRD
jgi:hypothetical protein